MNAGARGKQRLVRSQDTRPAFIVTEKTNELVAREMLDVDGGTNERARIEQVLLREGFDVTAAADGPSALRQIEAKPFALVVSEIRLPGQLDGVTTMRLARTKRSRLKCLSALVPIRLWGNDELDDLIAKPLDRREPLGCVFEIPECGALAEGVAARDLEHSYG
jgi:CheY-like chemotaxis protein